METGITDHDTIAGNWKNKKIKFVPLYKVNEVHVSRIAYSLIYFLISSDIFFPRPLLARKLESGPSEPPLTSISGTVL